MSVVLLNCDTYKVDHVTTILRKGGEYLGGFSRFISPGDRVLIKPNLLAPYPPESAVTTHPSVIEGIIRHVLASGGQPFIGDSPAFGDVYTVAEKAGIAPLCDKYGIPLVPFTEPVEVSIQDPWLKKIYVDKIVLEADVIINVPKLKTHVQVGFTGAVKNLFGCIPGKRKALWHFKAGDEDHRFGRLLIETYKKIKPALNIIDGIVMMDGNGPAQGDPRPLGLVALSEDAFLLDRVICEIIGVPLFSTEVFSTLARYYNKPIDIRGITITGDPIELFKGHDIKLPVPEPIKFDIMRIIISVLKHLKKKILLR